MRPPLLSQRAWEWLRRNANETFYRSMILAIVFGIGMIPVTIVNNFKAADRRCVTAYGIAWDDQDRMTDNAGNELKSDRHVCINIYTKQEKKLP